jgi:hypothetical protein
MKCSPLLLIACLGGLAASKASAQQLNWGSLAFSDLVDSKGDVLANTFVFEIGAFNPGFTPTLGNLFDWRSNWQVFDRASYNGIEEPFDDGISGYFTGTARMLDDGRSSSPFMTPSAPSFEGLSGYLWVRKGDDPIAGSEWMLTRADSWVFPAAIPGCCDNDTPFDWSTSDLDESDVPLWGRQGKISGPGEFSNTGIHTLQTYTFVPEPSSVLMIILASGLFMIRRRSIV